MVGLILVNLAISLVVCLVAVGYARRERGLTKLFLFSFVGAIVSGMIFFVPVFLQFGVMFLGLLLWPFVQAFRGRFNQSPLRAEERAAAANAFERRCLSAWVIAAPVISYGSILCWQVVEWRELARLRQMYPMESVATRLEYEQKASAPSKGTPDAAPNLSFATAKQLDDFDQQYDFSRRSLRLRKLHEQTTLDFSVAQGFGPMRMIEVKPRAENLFEADLGLISLDPPRTNPSPGTADDAGSAADDSGRPAANPLAKDLLESLHWNGRNDFLNADRIGYVRDRNHVAGFQSHRFTMFPHTGERSWQTSWRMTRLELIGLLKYDKPRAYVSKYLPRLQELGAAATRDVDAFESAALVRLRTHEDIVIDETSSRIRMLGSLRAGKTCIECHEVRRGEILGALTYEFVPLKTKPSPIHPKAAPTNTTTAISSVRSLN
jgi:hypothetical protein